MVFIKQTKNRTKIALKTRSNFWGLIKLIKLKKFKWRRIRTKSKIKPQFLRFFKKRLGPQQQFQRRAYKRLLIKKQNFKHYYGNLKESQLKQLFLNAKKKKFKKNQLEAVIHNLECRLDIVIFKMGFANSIYEAQNIITHGKILVNGSIIKSYNFKLIKGDIISIHPQYKYVIYSKLTNQLFLNKIFYILTLFPLQLKFGFKKYNKLFLNKKFNPLNKKINKRVRKIRLQLQKRYFFQKKKRQKKIKYILNLKTTKFLYKFKNKTILNILNKKKFLHYYKLKQFQLYNNIRTPINLLVNFKILIGIFLYNIPLTKLSYHSFMDLRLIQRYYNKK